MIRHLQMPLLAALLGLVCFGFGCGGSGSKTPPLVPATGKVTLDGAPMTIGMVTFQPDEAKGNTLKYSPTGPIDSSGNYKLMTDGKDGAPVGWYKVTISAYGMPTGQVDSKGAAPKSNLNSKYQSPATSGITLEVVASPAPGAYDLKVTK